jgi:hypothetical protein
VTTLTAAPSAAPQENLDTLTGDPGEPRRGPGGGDSERSLQIANTIVIALLFACPALMCIHAACANDLDVWWHLSTGQWILQHHAVPQTEPFSVLAGKPWQAYSWLFEVIIAKLFGQFGLVGLVVYTSTMVCAITIALYSMIKRLQSDFSVIVLLTLGVAYSIGHLYTPRPWMFTILFFVLELNILMHARRTGRTRGLLWLPVIFALWANIHIEFIDGLLVLGLAFAESIVARWWPAAETRVQPIWMGAAMLASLAATLANPYGWRVYSVVFDYSSRLATSGSALNRVTELQAMPFRDAADFLILLLALGSAAVLASKRRLVLFEAALLAFAVFASFRSQRDIWVMAIVSAMILASGIVVKRKPTVRTPRFAPVLSALGAALLMVAGFRVMHVNKALLETQVNTTLPADAVAAIRAHGYAGPVYDDYNWGGYLIWTLKLPVTMDGRASFYGDERIDRSVATWGGEPDWASDPQLNSAGVVIGPVKAALTQLLRQDARFQLVYEDRMAAVFVPQR